MKLAVLGVLVAGCNGGASGEPSGGTVSIVVGDKTIAPTVGAAIELVSSPPSPDDATKAMVILGTSGISCATDLNSRLDAGTYLTFNIPRAAMTLMGFVSVIRVDGSSAHLNATTGDIVIDAIDPRVAGTVSFTTTDDQVGTISASGTFDVIRCF